MSSEQCQKFCERCKTHQLHARPGTNHLLHLLISLFLCGLWIPIWILSSLKIGGWRCQNCGTIAGQKLLAIAALPLMLGMGLVVYKMLPSWAERSSNQPVSNTDPIPHESDQTNKNVIPPDDVQSSELSLESTPMIRDIVQNEKESMAMLPTENIHLKSLEGISLPVTLVAADTFSLLDATGKEVLIETGKKLVVTDRSPSGTLKVLIDRKLFVGNEMRLASKVSIDRK